MIYLPLQDLKATHLEEGPGGNMKQLSLAAHRKPTPGYVSCGVLHDLLTQSEVVFGNEQSVMDGEGYGPLLD